MWTPSRWLALAGLLLVAGCNNDNVVNHGEIRAGSRLRLVIDQHDSARLLFDSATGDMWQLQPASAGGSAWVRVASGPTDMRRLTASEALLGTSKTPKR